MNKFFKTILLSFIAAFMFFSVTEAKGYKIQIQVTGLKDTVVILGHHLASSLYADDTAHLDKNGMGFFIGKEAMPGGLYLILLPSTKYFDFLITEDQEFSISTDTTNLIEKLEIKGSEENALFVDYQKFMLSNSQKAKDLNKARDIAKTQQEKDSIKTELDNLNTIVRDRLNDIVTEYPNTFFAKFLLATKDTEVPEPPRDANGVVTDSTFQYRYFRSHYFDNFDVSDARLLRTPFYENKVMFYLDKVLPQLPDTIIPVVDTLIEKSRSTEELFRYMLITLFNHYAKSPIMGMDAVYLHIGEKYYIPEATWSDSAFLAELKDRVERNIPLLIGKKAPDVQLVWVPSDHFQLAITDTLAKKNPYVGAFFNIYDIKTKYTLLLFWDADCGHCKTAIPEIYKHIAELKAMGVEVIAIHQLGGVEGKMEWIDFVNKYQMYDWINAWNPYDYNYKRIYDISSTPVLFLLDENKTILAKKFGYEQLMDIVNYEVNIKGKNK
jgi:hypothetical protein